MRFETIKPIVNELPEYEKRRLLDWLQDEVEEVRTSNPELRKRLIKLITK